MRQTLFYQSMLLSKILNPHLLSPGEFCSRKMPSPLNEHAGTKTPPGVWSEKAFKVQPRLLIQLLRFIFHQTHSDQVDGQDALIPHSNFENEPADSHSKLQNPTAGTALSSAPRLYTCMLTLSYAKRTEPSFVRHPNATSSTIITVKPSMTPSVAWSVLPLPSASGIRSSATTKIIAPAAKARA